MLPRQMKVGGPLGRTAVDVLLAQTLFRFLRNVRPARYRKQIAAAVTADGTHQERGNSGTATAADVNVVAFASRAFHGQAPGDSGGLEDRPHKQEYRP